MSTLETFHQAASLVEKVGPRAYPEIVRLVGTNAAFALVLGKARSENLPEVREQRTNDLLRQHGLSPPGSSSKYPFPGAEKLTERELDVALFIAQALSGKEIGRKLGISNRTVEVHRYSIYKKLNVRGAAKLVAYLNVAIHKRR